MALLSSLVKSPPNLRLAHCPRGDVSSNCSAGQSSVLHTQTIKRTNAGRTRVSASANVPRQGIQQLQMQRPHQESVLQQQQQPASAQQLNLLSQRQSLSTIPPFPQNLSQLISRSHHPNPSDLFARLSSFSGTFLPTRSSTSITSSSSSAFPAATPLAALALGCFALCLPALLSPPIAAAASDAIASTAATVSDVAAGGASLFDVDDFQAGFASAFLLVLFSEIGDKTFFIAAVLATRRPNVEVFAGTFGALAVMTVLSVGLGRAFHYADELLPSFGSVDIPIDDIASVVLLLFFGISTLRDAAGMDAKAEEEQQEAEKAVAELQTGESGGISLAVLASVFVLVFTAEWGDKSFFSTIALAASSSPGGVVLGAVAAHGVATVMAVLGGAFLSRYISEQTVAYVGGTLFLVFAASTLAEVVTKGMGA